MRDRGGIVGNWRMLVWFCELDRNVVATLRCLRGGRYFCNELFYPVVSATKERE